jgi:hypothetical protein
MTLFGSEASRERWTLRVAIVAAVVALAAAFFTYKQWKSSDRAVDVADQARKDANHQAELQRLDDDANLKIAREDAASALAEQIKRTDQANALTKQIAEAAQKNTSIASQALSVSERAYLAVAAISIYCPVCEHPENIRAPKRFPVEATAAYLINIVNYGKTPAYDIDLNVTHQSSPLETLPANFDFAEDTSADVTIKNVAPDPSTPLQVQLPTLAEEILLDRGLAPVQRPEGESAATYLYMFGHISYTDIFKHRRTQLFCRRYIGPTLGIPEHWTRCAVHEEEVETFTPKKVSHPPGFALPKLYPPEPPNSLPPHP